MSVSLIPERAVDGSPLNAPISISPLSFSPLERVIDAAAVASPLIHVDPCRGSPVVSPVASPSDSSLTVCVGDMTEDEFVSLDFESWMRIHEKYEFQRFSKEEWARFHSERPSLRPARCGICGDFVRFFKNLQAHQGGKYCKNLATYGLARREDDSPTQSKHTSTRCNKCGAYLKDKAHLASHQRTRRCPELQKFGLVIWQDVLRPPDAGGQHPAPQPRVCGITKKCANTSLSVQTPDPHIPQPKRNIHREAQKAVVEMLADGSPSSVALLPRISDASPDTPLLRRPVPPTSETPHQTSPSPPVTQPTPSPQVAMPPLSVTLQSIEPATVPEQSPHGLESPPLPSFDPDFHPPGDDEELVAQLASTPSIRHNSHSQSQLAAVPMSPAIAPDPPAPPTPAITKKAGKITASPLCCARRPFR